MDDVTWLALTVALSVVGALGTWVAYRRRGLPAGMLGAGITLLFPAAYLTNTLRMLTRIVDAVVDWATLLVFSPTVWIGIVLAGMSVVLLGTSRALSARGIGARGAAARRTDPGATGGVSGSAGSKKLPPAQGTKQKGEPVIDDDLADIEAILRKRGIS